MDGVFVVSFDHYHLTLTFNCKIKVVGIVYASNKCIKTFSFIPMLIQIKTTTKLIDNSMIKHLNELLKSFKIQKATIKCCCYGNCL